MNLLDKLDILINKAGIGAIDFKKKITAVKIHFGEPGNLAYIRPNYAARIISYLLKQNAIPFLTDTNTLYHGRRSNGPEHIIAASENGFNLLSAGCPVIIADGVKGTDYRLIDIGLDLCKNAKIGTAIAESDILISLNHFKGHEMTGFGGALKNLGMGCASVGGKQEMHSGATPEIVEGNCTGCGICESNCAYGAVAVQENGIAYIDEAICTGCGQCIAVCQFDAARVVWKSKGERVSMMISEYALAALRGKSSFHINFIMNVSPDCDCWNFNDMPIVGDIGIAASFDPVALDQASADLVTKAPAMAGSRICEHKTGDDLKGEDKFRLTHPNVHWEIGLDHAEKIGLGTRKYTLTEI